MHHFISLLIKRNRELLKDDDHTDDVDVRSSLTSLAVAQNALRRMSLHKAQTSVPLQLVVVGPTQVGKSTLTNLLLQKSLAESSAQAGFTVHCQGFHVTEHIQDRYAGNDHWAHEYFGELQLSSQNQLDRQVLGEYSLLETSSENTTFNETVIWDTPDFDSIRSFDYRAPLVKTIALADLIVFVVSKEKYADKTVWVMLELLSSLKVPVVVVMNKTPPSVRNELKASIEKKYTTALPESALPPTVFIDEYSDLALSAVRSEELNELHQVAAANLSRAKPEVIKANTIGYIQEHWSGWTNNVAAEHRLQREYKSLVEKTAVEAAQRYKSEYIDSDRHREVIQLALSELLVLLEVPGMAKPLSKIRSVVTWPVRTLINSTKEASPVAGDDRNEERRLLDELGKHATSSLITSVAKKELGADGDWWRQRRQDVETADSEIRSSYSKSLDNYQTMLQVEIDRAAQSLYQKLKEQPATLNGLRAARVTTDAAAVVLAVKSGGLGAVDLVVAPAMLSLTTFLTEGALGKYMDRVQVSLTKYQEKEVQSIIDRKITKPLLKPRSELTKQNFISEAELLRMTERLESGDV